MASIEQILQQEINPFDTVTFRSGNFWQEQQNSSFTVASIHQQELNQTTEVLDLVAKSCQSRTVLLCGERGSGKSYLLGRLKRLLNGQAFFAYIGPWADSTRIWRHILRYTVDSLIHVPEGKQKSQLLLWLESLSPLKNPHLKEQLLSERVLFLLNLRTIYPTGIYQAKDFFSVLYELTNPQYNSLACDWLRGDLLDEQDLQLLGVKSSIDTEEAAQHMLANLGRLAADTLPIVLCFDQIDKLALTDGDVAKGVQPLFTVNSTIHNDHLKNFLIIISLVTETWKNQKQFILDADLDRLDQEIFLKDINLTQAADIWEKRLAPLHSQASPPPPSSIDPLTTEDLSQYFPGGKTNPRDTLKLGRALIQQYKLGQKIDEEDINALFKLVWNQELKKTETKINRINQLSSPDLITMLRETMEVLEIKGIKPKLLPSKTYSIYSFSYQSTTDNQRIGIVWTEDSNLTNFYYMMTASQKAVRKNYCQKLYLIRSESIGTRKHQCYKIYQKIFSKSTHHHFGADLSSVHYLATYHSLVNAACAGELVVGATNPDLEQLQALMRETKVLEGCILLQQLFNYQAQSTIDPVKDFILDVATTQQLMGLMTLIKNTCDNFAQTSPTKVEEIVKDLVAQNQLKILGQDLDKQAQLVCCVKTANR